MALRRKRQNVEAPTPHNWRTTDAEEIDRRRWRSTAESFAIVNQDPNHPIFSNFRVKSASGLTYSVEVRDVARRQFHCQCVDFRINGLGTCKHVEAVLALLEARFKREFTKAAAGGSLRTEILPDVEGDTLRIVTRRKTAPAVAKWFNSDGRLRVESPEEAIAGLLQEAKRMDSLRLSQEIEPWLQARRRPEEQRRLRREYELKVQSGEWPAQETKVPLFPYQREGMLHLAFKERALLADEMGLGKTIQAIAACALLRRLGQACRVLVVTPASLKTEWEEQIQSFTDLSYQLVFGARFARLKAYDLAGTQKNGTDQAGPFFTIVNYEQMLVDSLEVNRRLRPDIVVLDEAQRVKNWSTRTTQAVKRLQSRYAFVLTGTPIENRLDELYSIVDFLDPALLGPLFRFNREYYDLDDRGRPIGYRNLQKLQERIGPYLLRRRKSDVEAELPERSDRNHFVPLTAAQQLQYDDYEAVVARLASIAKRRPLTKQEQDKLLRMLGMMRMCCDTNYILNADDRSSGKLPELEKLLEECRDNAGVKVIVFSEWERMLHLVRELCERLKLGYAWHTGSVPQRRRRAEINVFKSDPACRVFLSTDSGSTGLNLQNASVVINCDLPWNPAKLEQRIARAWRKNQTNAVTVINLVAERSIEERMLETLAHKQALADGVLDRRGDLNAIKLRTGRQAFFEKLEQLGIGRAKSPPKPLPSSKPVLPVDRPVGFARAAEKQINGALVRCEERYPSAGSHSVLYVVVDGNAGQWRERLSSLHEEFFHDVDPLAPVQLEVIDRATDEALQRLIDAGLVARTVRASRPLFPLENNRGGPAPLSDAERSQAASHRVYAERRLRMARVLGDTGFVEEARPALLEATHALARALAIEHRLAEPTSSEQALQPPLAFLWGDSLPALREFVNQGPGEWTSIANILQKGLS